MARAASVSILPLPLQVEVRANDSIVEKLGAALRSQNLSLKDGDILVVKHKIISKSEGRTVLLASVRPSAAAKAWARACGGDARLIDLALRESREVLRKKKVAGRGVLISETRYGFVCANSGVDFSNVDGGKHAVLLPVDPDRSAARLRIAIQKRFGVYVAVIITDSFGRAWREGLTEVAIGVAGMKPLADYRRSRDPHGYELHASIEAIADELACAAGLVCGKLRRTPFCLVRGFKYLRGRGSGRELIRPRKNDLFR